MNKTTLRKIILILSALNMIAIILAIALYLPDTVATHFNYKGEADAWGSKWSYIMFALLPIMLSIFYEIYRKKSNNAKGNQALEDKLIPLISVVFICLGWLMIPFGNANEMGMSGGSVFLVFGILMLVLSNYMGKVQHNRTFGLRVPWTLKNETVWKKTHRLCGFTGTAGSLILIAGGIIGIVNPDVSFAVGFLCLMVAIILTILIPTVYSYLLYKKITGGEDQA